MTTEGDVQAALVELWHTLLRPTLAHPSGSRADGRRRWTCKPRKHPNVLVGIELPYLAYLGSVCSTWDFRHYCARALARGGGHAGDRAASSSTRLSTSAQNEARRLLLLLWAGSGTSRRCGRKGVEGLMPRCLWSYCGFRSWTYSA